jgi:hypothetical protein
VRARRWDLRTLAALALLAGCTPRPQPPVVAAPPPPAPATPAAPLGGEVTNRGAGKLNLGATEAQVRALAGYTAGPMGEAPAGTSRLGLRPTAGAPPSLIADLRDGAVVRVLVRDPAYATAAGVRVGAAAARLQKLYGRPTLVRREGALCAEFAKAPGLAFCFAPGSAPVRDWAAVVKRGLSVTAIEIRAKAAGHSGSKQSASQ